MPKSTTAVAVTVVAAVGGLSGATGHLVEVGVVTGPVTVRPMVAARAPADHRT